MSEHAFDEDDLTKRVAALERRIEGVLPSLVDYDVFQFDALSSIDPALAGDESQVQETPVPENSTVYLTTATATNAT